VGHTANLSVTKARHTRQGRIGRFLFIALVVHAELVLLIALGAYWLAPRDADVRAELAASKEPESIDVGMLDEDAARRIVADLERQDEARKAEEVKKEVDSVKAPGQVVDVPTPREEKRPDKARFASEHDTSVERETRKYGKFDPQARQGDAAGTESQSRPQTPTAPNPSATATPSPPLAMRLPPRATPGRPDQTPEAQRPMPTGA